MSVQTAQPAAFEASIFEPPAFEPPTFARPAFEAVDQIFDPIAQTYDAQPNPLLALEQRVLPELFPTIAGADILDVGCGTGRWLKAFEFLAPRSLSGADPSAAMLEQARQKLLPSTLLHQAKASALPGGEASKDLILASFVLSYVNDLSAFAAECARLLRTGGRLILSDMHPVTALARGWTRTFQTHASTIQLTTQAHTIDHVITTFSHHNLHVSALVEPAFADPERPLFDQADKRATFESLTGVPAIYLLQFERAPRSVPPAKPVRHPHLNSSTPGKVEIINAPWAEDAETWSRRPLHQGTAKDALDLSGYVVLPGLINAHDHLEFALFPNLGRLQPYQSATEWAHDIQRRHHATIELHKQVPLEVRIAWGALRNLLAGVTTVCHHNPTPSQPLPIHLAKDFGWAHSLAFAPDLAERFASTDPPHPFLLHAAEGTDSTSREELKKLDEMHLLTSRTVLIHGLALQLDDIELLNQRGGAVILCPTSNLYLFAQAPSNALSNAMQRVALGSDSPLTARGDLLDEIQYLSTQQHVAPTTLYHLVTRNPAQILGLGGSQGCIQPGIANDLVVTRDTQRSPAQTLSNLTLETVELVVVAGEVQLASPTLYRRLPHVYRAGLHRLEIAGHRRYVRAPLPELFASAESVLGAGELRLGGKEVYHLPAH